MLQISDTALTFQRNLSAQFVLQIQLHFFCFVLKHFLPFCSFMLASFKTEILEGKNWKIKTQLLFGSSVTRLGDFWKFLVQNLLTKVGKKEWRLFGLFCKACKTAVATSWATFQLQHLVTLFGSRPVCWACLILFKNGPMPASFVYFRSFHISIQMTNIQFEQYKLKKV